MPYFLYAKCVRACLGSPRFAFLPLRAFSLWIAQRDFVFFRYVAFDQLVMPQTCYISRSTVDDWLARHTEV